MSRVTMLADLLLLLGVACCIAQPSVFLELDLRQRYECNYSQYDVPSKSYQVLRLDRIGEFSLDQLFFTRGEASGRVRAMRATTGYVIEVESPAGPRENCSLQTLTDCVHCGGLILHVQNVECHCEIDLWTWLAPLIVVAAIPHVIGVVLCAAKRKEDLALLLLVFGGGVAAMASFPGLVMIPCAIDGWKHNSAMCRTTFVSFSALYVAVCASSIITFPLTWHKMGETSGIVYLLLRLFQLALALALVAAFILLEVKMYNHPYFIFNGVFGAMIFMLLIFLMLAVAPLLFFDRCGGGVPKMLMADALRLEELQDSNSFSDTGTVDSEID